MPYCTRDDIESIYGAVNVKEWADLDNNAEDATITARIDEAILDAGDLIDSVLRPALFTLPVVAGDDNAPRLIQRLAAMQAGVILYEARGSLDVNESTGQPIHRYAARARHVTMKLDQIAAGIIDIEAVRIQPRGPAVVEDA